MPKYVYTQKYVDPQLGLVHINVRSAARRFVARWRFDGVHITVPAYTTIDEYRRVLVEFTPRLLEKRLNSPEINSIGYSFSNDLWSVEIVHDSLFASQTIGVCRASSDEDCCKFMICVSNDWDFSHPDSEVLIRKAMTRIAKFVTHNRVLDEAWDIARAFGLSHLVKAWKVGRGEQRLGTCSHSGEISLSNRLAYMPPQLRRHIITHELAHLTHHNHSAEFHALWAKYDGSNHYELKRELKNFKFPI